MINITIEQTQTTQNVNNTFTLTMPFGISENTSSVIDIIDCVGNSRSVQIALIRDILPPQILITGIENGFATLTKELRVNVSDNNAGTNITVQILSQNNTEYVCYSVCSFILPTSLQFAHTSTGSVNVEIHTAPLFVQINSFSVMETTYFSLASFGWLSVIYCSSYSIVIIL